MTDEESLQLTKKPDLRGRRWADRLLSSCRLSFSLSTRCRGHMCMARVTIPCTLPLAMSLVQCFCPFLFSVCFSAQSGAGLTTPLDQSVGQQTTSTETERKKSDKEKTGGIFLEDVVDAWILRAGVRGMEEMHMGRSRLGAREDRLFYFLLPSLIIGNCVCPKRWKCNDMFCHQSFGEPADTLKNRKQKPET